MGEMKKTVFYDQHVALGANIVPFGGYDMPVMYQKGILEEHLATRKGAGIFDVSHMGRFFFSGPNALAFLQHVLTNNAAALDRPEVGAQYTFIPTSTGGAVDDAYLYRFVEDVYMLVVNASNRQKDWDHFQELLKGFSGVQLVDRSEELAMVALQGPKSRDILHEIVESGNIPEPARNAVASAVINGCPVNIARTGYTGEPLGFEIFIATEKGPALWDLLVAKGAEPIGLGARDTLRLEAGLPLYGHELGEDPEGNEIPIFSCPLAKFSVSFTEAKGDYVGKEALKLQHDAFKKAIYRDFSSVANLPRSMKLLALDGRGIARQGAKVYREEKLVGYITSGTMVPFWTFEGEGLNGTQTTEDQRRSICIGYLDSDVLEEERLSVDIRGKKIPAIVVPYHMRSECPPYARPILYDHDSPERQAGNGDGLAAAHKLIAKAVENHEWRQTRCINLIPSEMSISPAVRKLSQMDPSFRYAEHKKMKAFYEEEVYYYQGTAFIDEVEGLLARELKRYLGCTEVETRVISGQMANATVFSAMVDYLNMADRKVEPRRIARVMNNHIGRGGHLSSQPMGALKDFVARDPQTERPAVVNFPVLPDNLYRIDVEATKELIARYKPELIVFGKSMVITKEPVRQIRQFLDDQGINSVLMYDMAHVLGLVGSHFQNPFEEGADLVTGSSHKTFFGTQRGIVAGRFTDAEERWSLWEAIERRTFPGAVSNHHLGTLLGLLMATYEMNHFRDEYQPRVVANAKAFASALADCGLKVAGDKSEGYTETHQVILEIGYARGPEMANRLEANNIICNYQACPEDESFSASGGLRLGVSEMTRFGMQEADFQQLAELIRDVLIAGKDVKQEVAGMRQRFLDMQFCFTSPEIDSFLASGLK